jgi:hypothetical protein
VQQAAAIELDIALTASQLTVEARAAMMQESARIWRPHEIAFRWRPGGDRDAEAADLRVVVVKRADAVNADEYRTTIAELLPHAGDRASIIASVSAAQRVLMEAAQSSRGGAGRDDGQLGLVLGRAVAHEIGHFVLGTETHAPTGMMRALIPPSELAGSRTDAFLLDDVARRWLDARRRDVRGDALPWLRSGGFSYRTR